MKIACPSLTIKHYKIQYLKGTEKPANTFARAPWVVSMVNV